MGHGDEGDEGQGRLGKRLMVRQAHQPGKGKRNKFNLSPFPLTPFPIPMPNPQSPISQAVAAFLGLPQRDL